MADQPFVRVVVVNYNGGATTWQCLESLRQLEWPSARLEGVLVDNASTDGLAARVRAEMPWIRVIRSEINRGFAGGCNLAFEDLDAVDYVALLNSDATADRAWLAPLVSALEGDDTLGAACSKVVFAPSFVTLTIERPSDVPVSLTSLQIDGHDVWDHAQFRAGCDSSATRGSGAARACRLASRATVRVPTDAHRPAPSAVSVRVTAAASTRLRLEAGGEPVWLDASSGETVVCVPLRGERYDVINNVGSRLVSLGYGADRGFLEPDEGQYDATEEVFAWCGAAALLSTRYLREVGGFDGRYFMYYEDTDLAWRGRLAGWRYTYVPESRVRHEHAASSQEGSALFDHYVERNRLVTLARNAPAGMAVAASYRSLRHIVASAMRDVAVPLVRAQRPSLTRSSRMARAFGEYLVMLPAALWARRLQRVPARVRADLVEAWQT